MNGENDEIERRISRNETANLQAMNVDSDNPEKCSIMVKKDYIVIAIFCIICFAFIVWGYFL